MIYKLCNHVFLVFPNNAVRCMIMQSFLGFEWRKYGSFAKSVPESFILGPLMEALNDPVHHNDFGLSLTEYFHLLHLHGKNVLCYYITTS